MTVKVIITNVNNGSKFHSFLSCIIMRRCSHLRKGWPGWTRRDLWVRNEGWSVNVVITKLLPFLIVIILLL